MMGCDAYSDLYLADNATHDKTCTHSLLCYALLKVSCPRRSTAECYHLYEPQLWLHCLGSYMHISSYALLGCILRRTVNRLQ